MALGFRLQIPVQLQNHKTLCSNALSAKVIEACSFKRISAKLDKIRYELTAKLFLSSDKRADRVSSSPF